MVQPEIYPDNYSHVDTKYKGESALLFLGRTIYKWIDMRLLEY